MCDDGEDAASTGAAVDPNRADLGLLPLLGAGEAEAFLVKGLLRTEAIVVVFVRDGRVKNDHRMD